MDLLSGLRKGDSSRGGAAEFSWDQVKDDKDRENYLGHSLMAPVGRWQRNKDLNWYAKGDANDAMSAEEIRKEEIRRIKEAEQDALSEALGFPVAPRHAESINPNEIQIAIRAGADDDGDDNLNERGIGFGKKGGPVAGEARAGDEVDDPAALVDSYRPAANRDGRKSVEGAERRKSHRESHRRRRSRSRSGDRRHRHRDDERRDGHGRRSRSRSPHREDRDRHGHRERHHRSHREEPHGHRKERRRSPGRHEERSSRRH